MVSNLYLCPWSGVVLRSAAGQDGARQIDCLMERVLLVTLGSRSALFSRGVKVPHLDRKPTQGLWTHSSFLNDTAHSNRARQMERLLNPKWICLAYPSGKKPTESVWKGLDKRSVTFRRTDLICYCKPLRRSVASHYAKRSLT